MARPRMLFSANLIPEFQDLIGFEKEIPEAPESFVVGKLQWYAGNKQFLQIESRRNRPLRIGSMQNRKRDHNGARPRRHLVNRFAQQNNLGWNRRRLLARIEAEQTQVDLDVAVGRLQPAHRQNALPRTNQPRIVNGQPGQL